MFWVTASVRSAGGSEEAGVRAAGELTMGWAAASLPLLPPAVLLLLQPERAAAAASTRGEPNARVHDELRMPVLSALGVPQATEAFSRGNSCPFPRA